MAREKGELFPDSAPLEENYLVPNDGANHTNNAKLLEMLKKAVKDPSAPKDAAKLEKMLNDFKVPAAGEEFKIRVPRKLIELINGAWTEFDTKLEDYKSSHSESEVKSYLDGELTTEWLKKLGEVVSTYYETRALIESDVQGLKKFFGSQKNMPGKTKADILKEIWKELPKHMDTPVAPLDDEMLTNLAKEPAIIEGEFKHPWGTASKLYKSEAHENDHRSARTCMNHRFFFGCLPPKPRCSEQSKP